MVEMVVCEVGWGCMLLNGYGFGIVVYCSFVLYMVVVCEV